MTLTFTTWSTATHKLRTRSLTWKRVGSLTALVLGLVGGPHPLRAQPSRAGQKVAAGYGHSISLLANGFIATHGENRSGEIGNGTAGRQLTPFLIPPPSGKVWSHVMTGDFRSAALTTDGAMYSWGSGGYGQHGDNDRSQYSTPQLVAAPSGKTWVNVSAGFGHTLALCNDGTLYTWGDNYYAQLGNGTTTLTLARQVVTAPAGSWMAVAAGYNFSLALNSNGSLYAWGANRDGQLGDGTTIQRATPVLIAPPAGLRWTQVAAGFWNSAALCSDGSLYVWGNNYAGQIGDGTTSARLVPRRISPPTGHRWTQVSVGYEHILAVCSDGGLYAWGGNDYGKFGNGTTTSLTQPARVAPPAGQTWVQVACGHNHSLALASDGQVYTAGYNYSGQLGDGTTQNNSCFVRNCSAPLASELPQDLTKAALRVAPNPFTNLIRLTAQAPAAGPATVTLHTAVGQTMVTRRIAMQRGENEVTLAGLPPLPAGVYFLTLTTEQGRRVVRLAHTE
ncbi:RCC1 domain-containing protein [Hymenobacter metallicola]|uniref:T9SS type A sorting domain-containing protein n=1 Tax=Hymenobacter metallicola TaxID=2563114 RepID=A0A4Z0QC70_9BACT|nr:T9SS type A sorting domain-containing protein [Hymenobacter metallicola]TGE27698.1 T9SS type A sorting domain-containing protein [Hymenobacter metallicola]